MRENANVYDWICIAVCLVLVMQEHGQAGELTGFALARQGGLTYTPAVKNLDF